MRNLKKFLALVLAMLMVVSAAATVSAFDDVTEEHDFYVAIQDLVGKEIVQGMDTEGTTFAPEGDVTRLQAAIMFARAITGETDPTNAYWNKGLSQFSDVTEFQYAVTTAVNAGIINGMGDGTYNPTGNIQFIQALKMAVCALGYGEGLTWGADGMEYYNVAVDLGLTAGLDYIAEATKPLNRGEFAQLVYNMIYADLADGTGSIAYNVFKVGYVEPEPVVEPDVMTTFVITATDGQTAYEGMEVTETGWVGIQQLVAGIPEGDVIYIPVEMFGFEAEEDEDYFLHSFNLANWDAEDNSFDYIEQNSTSWKIYNTEISGVKTAAGYSRFAYDGANYYTVDELSDDAIRNEVVLYSATDFGYNSGKELFLNADDEVMHPTDNKPVLQKTTSANGNVRYRVLVDEVVIGGKTYTQGSYITYEQALEKYGWQIDGTELPYQILKAGNLTGAYEITAFNDDADPEMDRAYLTPVYMSVYEDVNGSKEHQTWGKFKGHDDDKSGNIAITGLEDLTKGDIFVYTFNDQLKKVTVIDVLELHEGTVRKINTTKQSASGNYFSTITLTDGTALNLYNYDKASDVDAKLGAAIQASGKPNYTKDTWMNQLVDTFEYVNDDALLERLSGGSLIRYYERNGIIVFAETYNIEDVYERVILKEIVDADLDAVYADVYRNGKVEEIAITMIGGKPVSEISWIKLSSELNTLNELAGKGNIFKISPLEEGYQLSAAFTEEEADEFGLVKMTEIIVNDNKETITRDDNYDENINIYDNIAEIPYRTSMSGGHVVRVDIPNYNKYNRLRTNENTIWYFINEVDSKTGEVAVKVFSGEIEDGYLALDPQGYDTEIYVDALGYGSYVDTDTTNKKSSYAGTASVVYVFNADLDNCEGFGWGEGDRSIVYVSVAVETAHKWDYYNAGDAEVLGLNAKVYDKNNYYLYSADYVMDMYTGKGVSVFSDKVLLPGNFYYVNEDGYVDLEAGANAPLDDELVVKKTLSYGDFNFDTNDLTLGTNAKQNNIVDEYDEVTTFAVLAFNKTSTSSNIKTAAKDIKALIPADVKTTTTTKEGEICYYLADGDDNEDGRFAIVAGDLTNYAENFALTIDFNNADKSEKATVTFTVDGVAKSYVFDADFEGATATTATLKFVDVDDITDAAVTWTSSNSKVSYKVEAKSDLNKLLVTRSVGDPDPIVYNATWGKQGNAGFEGVAIGEAVVDINKSTLLGTITLGGASKFGADASSFKMGVKKLGADDAETVVFGASETTVKATVSASGVLTISKVYKTGSVDLDRVLESGNYKMILIWTEGGEDYRVEYSFAN